jgi:enoyl-CoA hydratase/carnithine racemase
VDERATEVATALANASPTAVASGLTFVQQVRGRDWKTAGEIARRIRNEVFESEDFREGLQAFLDKREAKWPSLLPAR